ncbi:MAG: PAS domain S-box protein [Chloroflexi bacterium]|nr:PAS domain S-box protein [Chloroflexota bacterium]
MPSKSKQNKGKGRMSGQVDYVALSRDLVDAVESGVYIVQYKKFVYVNPFFAKLTGYSREELIGTRSLKLVLPQDRPSVRKKATRNLKSRLGSRPYEYRFIKKNGEIMWVMERVSPIGYMGQEATLGSFVDITERKRLEEALAHSEKTYRTILERMYDSYYEVDLAGNFTFVNDSVCRNLGYSSEEMVGQSYRFTTPPDDIKPLFIAFNQVFNTGIPNIGFAHGILRKDGSIILVESSISVRENEQGEIIGFRSVSRDITERKRLEEALVRSEERYRTILEQMQDSYYEVDLAGNYTFISESAGHSLGYSREELIGKNYRISVFEEDVKSIFAAFNEVYRTGKPNKGFAYRIRHKDGSIIFSEVSVDLKKNDQGVVTGFKCVNRDITERKKLEQKLVEMATHDFLTGLPNRVLLLDRFNIAVALAHRNKARLAAMSLDLDDFKTINDTFGHDAGDQVLKAISTRLTGIIRASDTVARVGGDEFILLMLETKHMEDATAIAQKIRDSFTEPFSIDGHQLHLTTSIGIAVYPEDAEDMETLIKKSDAMMYYSKGHGGNQFRFFSDGDIRVSEDHKSAPRI